MEGHHLAAHSLPELSEPAAELVAVGSLAADMPAAVLLAADKQAEQGAADMPAAASDILPADPGCPVFCQEAGECLPRSQ